MGEVGTSGKPFSDSLTGGNSCSGPETSGHRWTYYKCTLTEKHTTLQPILTSVFSEQALLRGESASAASRWNRGATPRVPNEELVPRWANGDWHAGLQRLP